MSRRLRLVRGGTHESKMCDCNKVLETIRGQVDITCSCTESRDFIGNVPDRWICDLCRGNRHEKHGVRQ